MKLQSTDAHSAHCIVCQLAQGLYDDPGDRVIAEYLAIKITKDRPSMAPDVTPQVGNERLQTELPEKVAQNISMRLKDNESKFSGDTTEC